MSLRRLANRVLVSHARPEAYSERTVAILGRLGYRIVGSDDWAGEQSVADGGARVPSADLLIVEGGGLREHHHMAWEDVFTLREQIPQSTRILVTHYDPRKVPDVSHIEGLELAQDLARYEV